MHRARRIAAAMTIASTMLTPIIASAQDLSRYSDEGLKRELAETATIEEAVLVPMRDGIGLDTNIVRPKTGKPVGTIFERTPYNEHVLRGHDLRDAVMAVRHGFAFIVQNERGRYFSQGKYEILGRPQTDGYDMLTWIAKQPWSNGKVGTLGCSSSAEWQLALAGMNHPAHAAMVPMSAGAGIGKVGRFQEQGNFYTGGAVRNLFIPWIYGVDNPLRAQIPADVTGPMRARIAGYNDLDTNKPKVDWSKQIKHLPVDTMLSDLGEPKGTFEELIDRTPGDPRWRQGGLYHDDAGWGVPALWFNTWYDVSIGPNMELFNHARSVKGDPEAAANQYAVVAPVAHCAYSRLGKDTVVGERDMGDTTFDVDGQVMGFFERFLQGDTKAFPNSTPHVRWYQMGENKWESAQSWPPADTTTVRFYLRSDGRANSLAGNGRLSSDKPVSGEAADRYTYDPMNPVQTIGGGDCCNGGIVQPGAYDQRQIEARDDVLVYTSEPLTKAVAVTGDVLPVLKVSSDAKDTDFAVKLVDVAPDGTAYIIGDTMMRARYRDGYDKPVFMQPNGVYTVAPTPIVTANTFQPGHRIRIEVTSSNFPKFDRNLNTGGPNESEKTGVIAHNAVLHDAANASYVDMTVQK